MGTTEIDVMHARGVELDEAADAIHVANVRGERKDIFSLGDNFLCLDPGRFKLVILDAFYRVLPKDTDENDNGTMAQVYNHLDAIAARLGCAFVLVHHSSKGNQSAKAVTDVGAAAGSQSRATDTHLILRPHEENVEDLASLRLPTPEIGTWFRTALEAALGDLTSHQHRQQSSLTKRRGELAGMQDRLLNAYLAGSIDEATFKAKGDDLKVQVATVDESLASTKTSMKRAPKQPCSSSIGASRRRNCGTVQQLGSSRDLGCGLFEPYFERRKSSHRKEKAV